MAIRVQSLPVSAGEIPSSKQAALYGIRGEGNQQCSLEGYLVGA